MGNFAFILLLIVFGLILFWYGLNHERDEDGKIGLLATLDNDATAPKPKVKEKGYALNAIRAVRRQRIESDAADDGPDNGTAD